LKSELRIFYRNQCQQVSAHERAQYARLAVEHCITHPLFKRSEHIACYLPRTTEFDSTPLIEAIWESKKHCYLPVVADHATPLLHFVPYHYGDALRPNKYAILEPANRSKQRHIDELDLAFLPLLAFDKAGHRLGSGGGYYDRSFADKKFKPILLGLGYSIQEADGLPADPWDVPLEGVLTEKGVTRFLRECSGS